MATGLGATSASAAPSDKTANICNEVKRKKEVYDKDEAEELNFIT